MNKFRVAFVLLAGATLAVASCGLKSDVEAETREYCNNVRDGVWPDYAHTYKQECGGKDPPKFNGNFAK